jgi:hypothetical protein
LTKVNLTGRVKNMEIKMSNISTQVEELEVELPVGIQEFEDFVTSLETDYNLPTKDRNSVRATIAAMIMNLGPLVARRPKSFFVDGIKAAAAKQVAHHVFAEIKAAQFAAEKEAKAKAEAEKANESEQQTI